MSGPHAKLIASIATLGLLACSPGDPPGDGAGMIGSADSAATELVVTHEVEGSGPSPKPSDKVRVHYHGTFPDGRVFDSSRQRGQPATFPLNGVIPCWTQGVSQMKVGGKAKLVCPPQLAYGSRGAGPIPPNSTLHFEVELLGIE